jgi:hypothetical protein
MKNFSEQLMLEMAGKGPVKGTMQAMGAAKKGGKYTWTGANNTKW